MKFTNEMLEKAKTAKSAEELLELAKAENIELSAEQAAKAFAELNKNGELSDEELDNVAGGSSFCDYVIPRLF
ncbi:MAG: Nif11-like leader peptide family natural product precursor [Candidatus Coproplasma sp.]